MNRRASPAVLGVTTALACMGPAASLLAQTSESESVSGGLSEVVVTATRREERLQDVPISVSAFSQEKIDAQGLRNMALAVTRRLPGGLPESPQQAITIRDVIDAYTINGARFLRRDAEAGSLETGKSADFVVLDQDILELADEGKADQVASTHVLETWFQGKSVYVRGQ